jgi:hypothetical protein
MRVWRVPVYYDQQGTLTRRFGIRQVPALVSQDGQRACASTSWGCHERLPPMMPLRARDPARADAWLLLPRRWPTPPTA